MGKLTVKGIAGLQQPGRHADGGGLCLVIDAGGRRYWCLRYMKGGRRRDMSLGPERRLSLADARRAAAKALQALQDGTDPIAARHDAPQTALRFADAARRVHAMRLAAWRNGNHQAQWLSTLETYAFPLIGDRPVAAVTRADVLAVLEPIWLQKPETARRVKQRIGAVIDWAVGAGLRVHGVEMHLVARALPRQPVNNRHLPALRAAEVPGFMRVLASSPARPTVGATISLTIGAKITSPAVRLG